VIHIISTVVCVWLLWSAEICQQRLVFFDLTLIDTKYEGWNFNSGNYLFTTDTK